MSYWNLSQEEEQQQEEEERRVFLELPSQRKIHSGQKEGGHIIRGFIKVATLTGGHIKRGPL